MTAPTTERVSTERVREMREAATPGPWEASINGRAGYRHADAALIAAAPDLAADLLDARGERDAAQHTADTLGARLTAAEAARVRFEEDVYADLRAVEAQRDAAEAARDALREVVRRERCAERGHENEATRWRREYIPAEGAQRARIASARRTLDAAKGATDALLAGAPPPATVPAALVRRQIGAVLAANGCDCDCGHSSDEHDDDCDRCLACRVEGALDAALAGCV